VINSQLNELKAQLEIVNEDRERLKKENEKLKTEKNSEISKILAQQKILENEKSAALVLEIQKLKKECEEKDFLLNRMRKLLAAEDFGTVLKENRESKVKITNITTGGLHQSRIPAKRTLGKPVRSISPYSTTKV
jgi:chromosome segregation ATPase